MGVFVRYKINFGVTLPKTLFVSLAAHLLGFFVFWQRHYFDVFDLQAPVRTAVFVSFREGNPSVVPREHVDESWMSAPVSELPQGVNRAIDVSNKVSQEAVADTDGTLQPDNAQPQAYLLADTLSAKPVALQEIRIPWPTSSIIVGGRQDVFSIFIDEFGVVRDVVPDGRQLTPAMLLATRNAFFASAFRPGMKNGKSVKTLLRIVVTFETTGQAAGIVTVDSP